MPKLKENACTFGVLMEGVGFWASLVSAVVIALAGFALFGLGDPPTEGGLSMLMEVRSGNLGLPSARGALCLLATQLRHAKAT